MKYNLKIEHLENIENYELAKYYPTYLINLKNGDKRIFFSTWQSREGEEKQRNESGMTEKSFTDNAEWLALKYFYEEKELKSIEYLNLEKLGEFLK